MPEQNGLELRLEMEEYGHFKADPTSTCACASNREIVRILFFYSDAWLVLKFNASHSRCVMDEFCCFLHSLFKLKWKKDKRKLLI